MILSPRITSLKTNLRTSHVTTVPFVHGTLVRLSSLIRVRRHHQQISLTRRCPLSVINKRRLGASVNVLLTLGGVGILQPVDNFLCEVTIGGGCEIDACSDRVWVSWDWGASSGAEGRRLKGLSRSFGRKQMEYGSKFVAADTDCQGHVTDCRDLSKPDNGERGLFGCDLSSMMTLAVRSEKDIIVGAKVRAAVILEAGVMKLVCE